MKRLCEQHLKKWIDGSRRKPLVLRGARQVGKSTVIRQFAQQEGWVLNEVNLERHLGLNKSFATLDMNVIRGELEGIVARSIAAPNNMLFLDEIQATPAALPALRYFYEELPDVPVIAAGSLLEFALSSHSFSMPVGRIEYLHLGPMTFREFLDAVEPTMCQYLDDFDVDRGLPETAHQKLLMRQRQYLYVGGMPEAILTFQESGSLEEAAAVHRSIISTYEDDFAKYAQQRELALVQRVFRMIPRTVGQKVKYVNFSREDRSRDVKAAIDLLTKARVCCRVFASRCSGVPLQADIKSSSYKLLFLDVGLMNHICGVDWLTLSKMDNSQLINEGAVAEQFVGQHLAYSDPFAEPQPVYWLREERAANAEVDYCVSRGPQIFPVEVKAGKSGRLRSLVQFMDQKNARTAIRFDLNQPSRQRVEHELAVGVEERHKTAFELLSLPLYAVGELGSVLDRLRRQ